MAFVYSFSNVTVGNPDFRMVGFGNFAAVLRDPVFLKSLMNTCIFTFTSIATVLVLSNLLTELLMREFRFKWLIRFLIMLPWTAPIALGDARRRRASLSTVHGAHRLPQLTARLAHGRFGHHPGFQRAREPAPAARRADRGMARLGRRQRSSTSMTLRRQYT
jgi:hypothetical protein